MKFAWPANCIVLNAFSSMILTGATTQVQQIPQPTICHKCKIGKATWGIPGLSDEWVLLLCSVCGQQGRAPNILKLNGRCTKCVRTAIFGIYKAVHCRGHLEPGETDLIHSKCSFPGCTRTQPAWGDEQKDSKFCRQHKQPSHIFLNKRSCKHAGCLKSPSFGLAGI